jgi:16S rRNA A1518/A1519 N6-dimethyltransferase RsmA/KsgA/DIM1 with predicted DNA glycosylase/AP lyase activity
MVVDRFRRLSLGQHFLTSDHIADAIVAACNILPTDTGRLFHSAAFHLPLCTVMLASVLEVGPGEGILTHRVARQAKRVVCVEKDKYMARKMTDAFTAQGRDAEVVVSDVLKLKQLPAADVCVSSVPYNISSPLTMKFLLHKPAFRNTVLMVQVPPPASRTRRPPAAAAGR